MLYYNSYLYSQHFSGADFIIVILNTLLHIVNILLERLLKQSETMDGGGLFLRMSEVGGGANGKWRKYIDLAQGGRMSGKQKRYIDLLCNIINDKRKTHIDFLPFSLAIPQK